MKKVVDKIPFLRFAAALSAGIFFGSILKADNLLIYFFLLLITALIIWLHLNYSYNRAAFFGLGVLLFFLAAGMLVYNRYNQKPEFYNGGKFIGIVSDIIQEKPKTYQSVIEIHSFIRNDSLFSTEENVLVYFEADENSVALLPGQTIIFTSSPRMIKNSGNPFEFDYKRYMERRKIYRQVYLASESWMLYPQTSPFKITILAEQVRMHLLNIFKQQKWNEQQLNVLSALTLGYKRGLDQETKKTFASAGAMHILAVSGLHTGILFLILTLMFGFLKKQQKGRILFILVVIFSLWAYAFLTGLSPSVKRAAAMFTLVVIGQNLRRQVNIYNSLAASAFFLLLLNPNNLFDAGFQLSYSAVFGIVFLQPRFEKLIHFRFKILKYFWGLLTVSVAAQIATFPFAVFYFNQLPVYFWLSNLLIIPAVTILIPLGIILLIFSWIPHISLPVAGFAGHILSFLIEFLKMVEHLPHSVINLYFSVVELVFVLSALLSLIFFVQFRNQIYFRSIFMFLFLFLSSSLIRQTSGLFRNEIILYNYEEQNVVHFISGKKNYVISEEVFKETDRIHNLIHNAVVGLQLHPPLILTCNQFFNDSQLYLNNGFILFEGKVIHFFTEGRMEISPFVPDVLIGNPAFYNADKIKSSSQIRFPDSGQDIIRITDDKIIDTKRNYRIKL